MSSVESADTTIPSSRVWGKVVGYIILPLKPEKIAKLLREEERTLDLEPEEIEVFKPGVRYISMGEP